jgi:hypothetical protein
VAQWLPQASFTGLRAMYSEPVVGECMEENPEDPKALTWAWEADLLGALGTSTIPPH